MSQNSFNGIVPPRRKSIRNISRSNTSTSETRQNHGYGSIPPTPRGRGIPSFFSKYSIWIISGVLLVITVIALSFIFSYSKIIVNPKQKEVTVDGQFTALREPEIGGLSYEIMQLEKSESQVVTATDREKVKEKASGKILIFNNFSTKKQRLVTNTRFETPEGLIYRINKPVIIPGQDKNSDGSMTPGSVEIMVYADKPGENYNIPLKDFTIPGFKGSPQYDKFYARSKTPMTGGFDGDRLKVDDGLLSKTKQSLEKKLQKELLEQISTDIPSDFYFFEEGTFFKFSDPVISDEGDSKARIESDGTAYAVIFKKKEFAQYLAQETISDYEGRPVYILSTEDLTLKVPERENPKPWEEDSFTFSLKGMVRIIWTFDENNLKEDLRNRPRSAVYTILKGYPAIDKAQTSINPFWRRSFQNDPEKILVEIQLKK